MSVKELKTGAHFWQWDTGQKLRIDTTDCGEVHFCNGTDDCALIVQIKTEADGTRTAEVPNILLQTAKPIRVYLYQRQTNGAMTRTRHIIQVFGRKKPADYVYTETEILNYASLDERINHLEGEGLSNAIENYLKENPPESGATEEEAKQIAKNKEDIETLSTSKLDAEKLLEAVSTALALAKASGSFDGKDGTDGEDGKDGVSPVVSVSAITGGHRITITDKNGTKTVDVLDGTDGKNGSDGKNGNGIKSAVLNANYTLTMTFDDGTTYTTPSIRGATGATGGAGKDGTDGVSPTVTASKSGKVTTITITDKNGTKTATINDGVDGSNGKDGTSVTVKSVSESTADGGSNVVTFSDGKTLTVKNGGKGSTGDKGDKGDKGDPGAPGADGAKGDTGEQGIPGNPGDPGERGHGILKVTTAPSSYTTATGGKNPIKRMSLSTIKSQANVDEVLVGDQISYSYYLYNIYYIDSTYAYMDVSQSIRGASGAAGKNGADGYTPVKGTDYWTDADKAEIVDEVSQNITIETVPDYVVTEAKETAKKVLSHQSEDCFTLAWLSDIHIGNSYNIDGKWVTDDTSAIEAGQGLHEMSKTAPCDMIALGGDLASGTIMTQHEDGMIQLDKAMEYMRPATFHTPTLHLVGNHDDVPWRATSDRLSRAELFSRFGKKNLLCGAVTNDADKGCNYGYLDFENRKMRVIYLDTHDKNGWESTNRVQGTDTNSDYLDACNVSAKQLDWLANVALDFSKKKSPSEWGIVVLSHTHLNIHAGNHTYTDATSGSTYTANTDNVIKVLTDYLSKAAGSITLNGETAIYDFSGITEKANLYCCINGHRHCYEFREYGGKKIPGITCPNTRDGGERAGDDGKTYTKTPGTGESCSFNVITIDRKNGKIYADNHGAGIDRVFDVVVYVEYVNLIPQATEPVAEGTSTPSTAIYNNGLGYKNNTRLSGILDSGGTGYVATGCVPYKRKADGTWGTIYIKGATLDTTQSYVRFVLLQYVASNGVTSNKATVGGSTTANTMWSTYFNIETIGDQYYKLTPTANAGFSGNAIAFRMSLIGSGENLIITIDEPIS